MANDDLHQKLIDYLTDVHSLEQNAIAMLRTGAEEAGDTALKQAFQEHLTETEEHARLIAGRLESLGESSSTLKDVAAKGGAMVGGLMAKANPDTTGKLAAQAYSFEHLEIASYRMLRTTAEQAGDAETVQVAERILAQEETAAEKLSGLLEQVARYDLQQMGAAA